MATSLSAVVEASTAVAATPARSRKLTILADLLRAADSGEVAVCVGLLSGALRQRRLGVGYATIHDLDRSPAQQPSLTVGDLDAAIDRIAAETGPGSAARRRELLGELLGQATEPEAQFIIALLTGNLRQGALAGIMADAVAGAAQVKPAEARRALMLSGDLAQMAEIAITQGEAGLRAVGLRLFVPVQPMLASPGESVGEALAALGRASVEFKLDGLRVQVHRRDDEVRVYSRNLNDITSRLPGVVTMALALPLRTAILDGEALWMRDDGPATFQDTMSQIDADAPAAGIVTFLFDLLHLDGSDLLDRPLAERREALRALAPELAVPSVLTDDVDTAQQVLDDALAAGHEGVVVKDAGSAYVAGRRGAAWRKVKPVHTYDLVVLGAEWGHGRRRGWLSNLHLGAPDGETGEFVMVGKTFKGLTDELLSWQTEQLLDRETHRQGIAVLVRPELVVEVAIDGVQSSTRYAGGLALRFARVRRYRSDKAPADADTIATLQGLLAPRR
ncbi:MAG: ATP-dependent DNA ligase [Solirubrobacteraceae bacterium]